MKVLAFFFTALTVLFFGFFGLNIYEYDLVPDAPFREGDFERLARNNIVGATFFGVIATAFWIVSRQDP